MKLILFDCSPGSQKVMGLEVLQNVAEKDCCDLSKIEANTNLIVLLGERLETI